MPGIKDRGLNIGKCELYQRLMARGELTITAFGLWGTGKTVRQAKDLVQRIGLFTRPDISKGNDSFISGSVKLYRGGNAEAGSGDL